MPKSAFTDAYASLRATLVQARKEAGVSQVELGARLGKTQVFVSNYERGIRRLDVIEFYAVARALRIPPAELFDLIVRQLPERVAI